METAAGWAAKRSWMTSGVVDLGSLPRTAWPQEIHTRWDKEGSKLRIYKWMQHVPLPVECIAVVFNKWMSSIEWVGELVADLRKVDGWAKYCCCGATAAYLGEES